MLRTDSRILETLEPNIRHDNLDIWWTYFSHLRIVDRFRSPWSQGVRASMRVLWSYFQSFGGKLQNPVDSIAYLLQFELPSRAYSLSEESLEEVLPCCCWGTKSIKSESDISICYISSNFVILSRECVASIDFPSPKRLHC